MARPNYTLGGGFRPLNAKPADLVECWAASAYGTDLIPGDPVLAVSDGSIARSGAGTDGIYGVIVEVIQYKDPAGFVRRNAKYLPASTTWTAHQERSLLLVCPCWNWIRFAVGGDDTESSFANARTLKFNNADHSYSGARKTLGVSGAQLDLSTATTTNTLQWRIEDFYDPATGANDPTQVGAMYVVYPNVTSGIGGTPSTTGV